MLLAPHDARRFMATYERVAIAVQAINQQQAASDPATCLVNARRQLLDNPERLDEVMQHLREHSIPVDPEVIEALSQMKLAEWIHIKDLKSGAIFLNKEASEAYSTVGLTQQPGAILGGRGFLVETGLCPFAGKILCDGLFVGRVQLGPNLWSEFHERYLWLKAEGRLHRSVDTAPPWQPAPPKALEILEPWQMVPLEYADDAIAFLKAKLQPHHPLQEQELFPVLKREDCQIWIVEKENDDGTTWHLDLTRKRRFKGHTIYAFRELMDNDELEQLIQNDHQQWLAQFDDDDLTDD
jgi:hypothetical protein